MITRILKALKRKPKRYLYKSAVTGRWISRAEALAHPETTYRIPVR